MSVVSLYYYLRVLKRVYVAPPDADSPPIESPALSQFLVVLLAAAVLLSAAPRSFCSNRTAGRRSILRPVGSFLVLKDDRLRQSELLPYGVAATE